ncbi:peptidoglycan-binding protein [Devosia sp. LjRoot16]|uniref:peptidoglycan-binding protein n=1 Tax=Devosia sp. LjRoot16 TaxID=3342271 RepID=UPI003ECFA83A
MNPNVPRGAAVLLDYIGGLETARKGAAAYNTVIGHIDEKGKLPKPVTSMTLEELLAEQLRWVRNLKQKSGAAGRYQIIRKTLKSLVKELKLPLTAKFSPDLQDAMGLALLERRGYGRFVDGAFPLKSFGNELAEEWASLPVLSTIKIGGKKPRTVRRGQSYYAGDGINQSLDDAAAFESVLAEALNERDRKPAPKPSTGPAAFPVKGAKNDEVVAQVQRRLKELGYSEIGNVDGDFGDLTEKAILIFRHDARLPLSGAIDSSLITALIKAKPREMPAGRAEASAKEVREAAPEAKTNWLTKVAGFWSAIVGAVIAFLNWVIGSFADIREFVQPFLDLLAGVPVWVYALAFAGGALWLYLNGRKGEAASVEAVQEGARR